MSREVQTDVIRRFNRTVTERIGALQDQYLHRGRPLGASRLLWEIDDGGVDVRRLRSRLGLDSGYTSRLLRRLEADGLVEVQPDAADQRVRRVALTPAGVDERRELNRLSDDLAGSILDSLDPRRAALLVDAMGTVSALLDAGSIIIGVEDPASDDARSCIEAYFAELGARFDSGFDPEVSISADAAELTLPVGMLLVARLRGEPIGCGALKLHGDAPAEIKRMWVDPTTRGMGLGRRILSALEWHAADRGAREVRLETNGTLVEAIDLYRSAGFREVDAFNDEPYAHHWFEKSLEY